ncbi:hypothetical protein PENTCL1PPCAC_14349, partial [Pristionchus entomophagus]
DTDLTGPLTFSRGRALWTRCFDLIASRAIELIVSRYDWHTAGDSSLNIWNSVFASNGSQYDCMPSCNIYHGIWFTFSEL